MTRHVLPIVCISIALAVLLVACGRAPAPVTTSRTTQPIIPTPTPTSSPTPIPTAAPLPDDIVVYPGAQLVLAQPITTGTLYFYRSSAALGAVTTFYVDQMPQKGWTQTSAQMNGSQGNLLVYVKGTRSVMLSIVPDPITPAQTDISLTLSDNP